jgi:hypothetical protein
VLHWHSPVEILKAFVKQPMHWLELGPEHCWQVLWQGWQAPLLLM